MARTKTVQMLVLVTPEQHAWAKEEAAQTDRSMGDVIRGLIDFVRFPDEAVYVVNRFDEDDNIVEVEEVWMDPRQTGALEKLQEYIKSKEKVRRKKKVLEVAKVENPADRGTVPRHTKSEAWAGYTPSGKRLTDEPIKHHLAVKLAREVCLNERRMTCIYVDGKLDRVFSYHKGEIKMRRF